MHSGPHPKRHLDRFSRFAQLTVQCRRTCSFPKIAFSHPDVDPGNFMTSSDRFPPVPLRSAVKSNLTAWCRQNLANRALNGLA